MTVRVVYSTDDDLIKIRPNILDLGVPEWIDQHKEAFKIINRAIIARWYKSVAAENEVDWTTTEFDADLVDISQVLRLACYKTLELAYIYLTQDSPNPGGFERENEAFARRYNSELNEVLAIGLSYDWDQDDEFDDSEKYQQPIRRLKRC